MAESSSGAASRLRVNLWVMLVAVIVSLVLAEVTARTFWRLGYDVSMRDPGQILLAYYPELAEVTWVGPTHEDRSYDVLLLGGSVLHPDWGQVERALVEQLAQLGRRDVRVFNLAMPAHTSRDSMLKYSALTDERFELVVFYHGINETRVNNAPAEVFREDYGHYAWYSEVNAAARHHAEASFALPYTVEWLAGKVQRALAAQRYVPSEVPRAEWLRYGRDYRSARSLRQNLETVLDLADERGDPVLLMTFSSYVPAEYSPELFREERLAYGLHLSPLEIWGRPEHVVRSLAAHNEVIRGISEGRPGVLFVDQARLMGTDPAYYNDVCHLTVLGSLKFVEYALEVLK